jgi:hypothetical protein
MKATQTVADPFPCAVVDLAWYVSRMSGKLNGTSPVMRTRTRYEDPARLATEWTRLRHDAEKRSAEPPHLERRPVAGQREHTVH